MEIIQLKYLETLVRLKSFKKAAASHFVSTSTLTRQVSSMENELGFPLFRRSASGITLTEQGSVFYRQTRKILTIYENAVTAARNTSGQIFNIRVEIFSYNRNLITHACEAAQAENENLRFSFVSCRLAESFSALLNHRIDVALLTDIRDVDDRFYVIPIYEVRQAVIVPDTHSLADREQITLNELDGQTIQVAVTGKEHRHYLSQIDFYRRNCPNSELIFFQHPHQADAVCQMNQYPISGLSILEPNDGFRLLEIQDAPRVQLGAICRREDEALYREFMECCRDYFARTADFNKVSLL